MGGGKFLTDSDAAIYGNMGLDVLKDIMHSCRRMDTQKGDDGVSNMPKNSKIFMRKWYLNFLSTMVLHSSGQRPQVLIMIEFSYSTCVFETSESGKKLKVFRESFIPKVSSKHRLTERLFPQKMYQPLNFHVDYILPAL